MRAKPLLVGVVLLTGLFGVSCVTSVGVGTQDGTGGSAALGGSGGSGGIGASGGTGGTGGSAALGGSGGSGGIGASGGTGGFGAAPAPGELDPYERVERLGRGINLGDALHAPNEGDSGVQLEANYFELIRDAGFNSVRIPIGWSAHASQSPPHTIDETFFSRVDWAVNQALGNGLLVVINMHHYEEMMSSPQVERARFIGLWEQIATGYQDQSGDLLFELLNEPADELNASLWNEILGEAIAKIRETNPGRTLIVGGVRSNAYNMLAELDLPAADRNLIATFHYHRPVEFTHQEASWIPGSDDWLGITWEATSTEQTEIRSNLDTVANWSEANDRPIYLGEFGAYERAEMASRERWTTFVARSAEERGFAWAYWEFCSGFGAYDSSAGAWRPQLLRALIPP